MKKIAIIGLLVLMSFLVTQYEINDIRKESLKETERIYVVNKDLTAGCTLEESDLEEAQVLSKWNSKDYYQTKESIIGQTLKIDVTQNMPLTSAMFIKQGDTLKSLKPHQAITTLKLMPEEALCWEVQPGETVNLYYIDDQTGVKSLGQVTINQVLDDYTKPVKDKQYTTYLLIEGPKSTIEKVMGGRKTGRFELMKLNNVTS